MVGELIGADREQVTFQRPATVVVGQAVEKAQKRLLNDVLAGAAAAKAAFDEGEQPAFVADDQIAPSIAFATTNALDEQGIGVARGGHGEDKSKGATGGLSTRCGT